MGCYHGALAIALARPLKSGRLWVSDTNHISLSMAAQTLNLNEAARVELTLPLSLLPGQEGQLDSVVVDLPKGRKLARRWLVEAFYLLKTGGKLYIAGANQQGVQAVIKDAQALFSTTGTILAYKKGNRAVRLVKTGAASDPVEWAAKPGIAPGTWNEFSVSLRGAVFHLRTLPGVFSYQGLDEGTRLLIDNVKKAQGARVLDFGCGAGVIGLHASACGASFVDMIDSDLLSVACARENILLNRVDSATVFPSDVLKAVSSRRYDLILSNPPFHTGKEVDYAVAQTFIAHAVKLLEPEGRIVVVANRFIRYERLLAETFSEVEILAQTGKYHVLAAGRPVFG